ncbi:MAG: alpha/beta hydrolase-fold protein, partial [Prolixibacteraceae bacterium]
MKYILLLLIALFFSTAVSSKNGRVLESLRFESELLDYPVEYSVYLPPDYDYSQRNYPVLYLLHGYSDDETGWIQFGEANIIA